MLVRKTNCFLLLLWLVAGWLYAQENVILPDHKPLLGEVHYGNRVGGLQAQEGETVQITPFEPGDILKSLQVFVSEREVISGFKMEIEKNGIASFFSFGSTHGIPQDKFLVPKGLNLVGIQGGSGWFIDSIAFVFDDGSTTPLYGGRGGDLKFSLVLNKNADGKYLGRLMGFWGSSTDMLETIGLVFWPIE